MQHHQKSSGEHLRTLGPGRSVPDVQLRKQSMYQPPRRALSEHLINGDVLGILSRRHGPSQLFYQIKAMRPQTLTAFLKLFCHPECFKSERFQANRKFGSHFLAPEVQVTKDSP